MAYDLSEIRREVGRLAQIYPEYDRARDRLFVLWFLTATVAGSEALAERALTGGTKDGGADAVFIDSDNRSIYLVQGKYHASSDTRADRSDVKALADLGRALLDDDETAFQETAKTVDATLREKLREARRRIQLERFELYIVFLITGRVTAAVLNEARGRIHHWRARADFDAFGADRLVKLIRDYQEGAAPPVPVVRLKIHGDEAFERRDARTGLTHFLAAIDTRSLAEVGERHKDRIFARNVRGFRGDTKIGRAIARTLRSTPEYFWYYNNGITIICDEVERMRDGSTSYLSVRNPQIINGQQTTRVLALNADAPSGSVLGKVIAVPFSGPSDKPRYQELIQNIVRATNRQSPISEADLQSTDDEQVRIDDEMRKTNRYVYIRKRAARSELHRLIGGRIAFKVSKEDLARALAACLLDPAFVQKGTDFLFGLPYRVLFPSRGRPLREYLSAYWLSECVRQAANDDRRRRSYARWVVLRALFNLLEADLNVPARRRAFVELCERDRLFRRHASSLHVVVNALFADAHLLYRKTARTERGLERAAFFKRTGVYRQMRKSTKMSSSDLSRPYVQKHLAQLRRQLRDLARAA